jgi:urea ABC transporter, ATP-binding protein UrtD
MSDDAVPTVDEPAGPGVPAAGSVLYLDGVSVSFDGFKALNGLSLVIAPGELRTIIGPNGAGKTTMMDVITGKTRPDTGDVLFDGGIDLTRLDESAIANLGIGRKFQKPTVFEHLSVFENLELALKTDRGTFATLFFRLSPDQRDRIDAVMARVGLADKAARSAGALSHGQKQWLEIGMLLMQDQRLLLLDEPVAGLTDAETEATADLILDLARDRSRSLVVVEHDMEFVRALGAKVTVLHEGSVLAEGSLDTVQANAKVVEVYLGR